MRERAWAVGGVGSGLGLLLVAWAVLGTVTLPGLEVEQGAGIGARLGADIRAILAGIAVIAVSLGVTASMRRAENWTQHVFVVLGLLVAIAAAWWAVVQLLG